LSKGRLAGFDTDLAGYAGSKLGASRSLWWAAGYNVIAIPLAAGAVLMSASTIIVALDALLLRRTHL